MWFTSLFAMLKRNDGRYQEGRPRRRKTRRINAQQMRSFVPRLEILEDRSLPSTLTVLNNLDSGAGFLRDTITHAKSGDTIVFAPSLDGQTIALTSDQLTINKSLDIEGPGATLLAISGNDTNRVFNINEGYTVTIAGLTIAHGHADGNGSGGAGILNSGSTLTIANDVLSYNETVNAHFGDGGGAIDNRNSATLTVTGSTFIGNQIIGRDGGGTATGGGIANLGSTATVTGSTFTGNRAVGGNGGIATAGDPFDGEGLGGGIHTASGPGGAIATLTVEQSTFTANQAIGGNGASTGSGAIATFLLDSGGGGCIFSFQATLVVSGSTFAYNQARGGSNATAGVPGLGGEVGNAFGGVLDSTDSVATFTNSTLDHNEALGGNGNAAGSGPIEIGWAAGGGIVSHAGFGPGSHTATLTASNLTFSDNQAVGGTGNTGGVLAGDGIGGGLANTLMLGGGPTATATATVSISTFTGNLAIGGGGSVGQNGSDGLGGSIVNFFGATLTVSGCTLTANQAVGGAGGAGGNGGNGFGGGIFNDGQSTLTVTGSTITKNQATGGAAGSGGSVGLGKGGGVYFASGGVVCLDAFTVIAHNHASTSNDDVFGVFKMC